MTKNGADHETRYTEPITAPPGRHCRRMAGPQGTEDAEQDTDHLADDHRSDQQLQSNRKAVPMSEATEVRDDSETPGCP